MREAVRMMAERRDSFAAALSAVRRMAREGRFAWGEPIVIKSLAAELRLSSTPVREALSCISGLGLIEHRQGHGYFFPALSAADIIDLFDLEWTHVHAALTLHDRGAATLQRALSSAMPLVTVQALFAAVVGHTGNEALGASHRIALERLAPVYRALDSLWADDASGAEAIAIAGGRGGRDALLRATEVHHRARCAQAGEIARALRRESGRQDIAQI